jgi:hypothetical protein
VPSLGLRVWRGETSTNALPAYHPAAGVIIVVGGARANAHARRDFELYTRSMAGYNTLPIIVLLQ